MSGAWLGAPGLGRILFRADSSSTSRRDTGLAPFQVQDLPAQRRVAVVCRLLIAWYELTNGVKLLMGQENLCVGRQVLRRGAGVKRSSCVLRPNWATTSAI